MYRMIRISLVVVYGQCVWVRWCVSCSSVAGKCVMNRVLFRVLCVFDVKCKKMFWRVVVTPVL